MRFIRETAPARTSAGVILPESAKTMTKQEILKHYNAATRPEQSAITAAAREYLTGRNITVDRRSLDYWRKNEMPRSPLARRYLEAYRVAITRRALKPAAQL